MLLFDMSANAFQRSLGKGPLVWLAGTFSLSIILLSSAGSAMGQGLDRWEFGAGPGFVSGSPAGTQFAEVFTADYRLRNSPVSIGPMVQAVLPGNYTQIAGAIVARYEWEIYTHDSESDNDNTGKLTWKLVPFMGLGGLHSEVKKLIGGVDTRTNDVSYYATAGASLNLDFNERFGLSWTYMNNMHDIRTGDGRDRNSSAFFVALRFRQDSKRQ